MIEQRQGLRDISHAIGHLEDSIADDEAKEFHIKLALNLLKSCYDRELKRKRYDDNR